MSKGFFFTIIKKKCLAYILEMSDFFHSSEFNLSWKIKMCGFSHFFFFSKIIFFSVFSIVLFYTVLIWIYIFFYQWTNAIKESCLHDPTAATLRRLMNYASCFASLLLKWLLYALFIVDHWASTVTLLLYFARSVLVGEPKSPVLLPLCHINSDGIKTIHIITKVSGNDQS